MVTPTAATPVADSVPQFDTDNWEDYEEFCDTVNKTYDMQRYFRFVNTDQTTSVMSGLVPAKQPAPDQPLIAPEVVLPKDGAPSLDSLFDTTENPIDPLAMDVNQLRCEFGEYVVQPALHTRCMVAEWEKSKKCIDCAPYAHSPARVNATFNNLSNLRRHITQMHTPWANLELYMLTDDSNRFECPAEICTFRTSSILKVRNHCTDGDCPADEHWEQMILAHDVVRKEQRDRNNASRRTHKALAKDMNSSSDDDNNSENNVHPPPAKHVRRARVARVDSPSEYTYDLLGCTPGYPSSVPQNVLDAYAVLADINAVHFLVVAHKHGYFINEHDDAFLAKLDDMFSLLRLLRDSDLLRAVPVSTRM